MKNTNLDSGQSAKENTIPGLSEAKAQAWIASDGAGNFNVIALDILHGTADLPIIEVKKVDASGVNVGGVPTVTDLLMKLDFGAIPTTNKNLHFYLLKFKDADNACAAMQMTVIGTTPEAVP